MKPNMGVFPCLSIIGISVIVFPTRNQYSYHNLYRHEGKGLDTEGTERLDNIPAQLRYSSAYSRLFRSPILEQRDQWYIRLWRYR